MSDKEIIKKDKEVLKLTQEKAILSAKLATQKAKQSVSNFRLEVRKATSTAIIAAFSFLIALVWKDLITLYVNKLSTLSPVQGQLFSTFIITVICVVGIIITTKVLSHSSEEKKD